jgi:hypothetical protein
LKGLLLFGAWCQRGSELTIIYVVACSLLARFIALSTYLTLWTCKNLSCGVMDGDVVNLEPF